MVYYSKILLGIHGMIRELPIHWELEMGQRQNATQFEAE